MTQLIHHWFYLASLVHFSLVVGSLGWKQGFEYLYRVEGRLLTGIPDISNEFSGIQLSHLQQVIPLSDQILYVKTENLQVDQVFKRLTDEDGDWRKSGGKIKGTKSVSFPREFKEHLTSPMNLVIGENGTVNSIIVENNLPEWAINIKRSHAADFNLDIPRANLSPGGSFYETVEESLYGRCRVSYTVNENKKYSAADSSNFPLKRDPGPPNNFEGLCPGHYKFFEIVKTVNFSSCGLDSGSNSVLYYSSVPEISPDQRSFTPSAGSLGSLWGRSLDTRYLICSPENTNSFHDYRILRMTQTEQFFSGLRDTEKLIAGSSKTTTLESIKQFPASFIQKNLEQQNLLKNLRAVLPLTFTFDRENGNENEPQSQGNLFSALSLTPVQRTEIPKIVLSSLGKISKELVGPESKTEVLPEISRVCKLLEKLNYEEIGQIQEQIRLETGTVKEEKEIKQSIFYDSLSMTGSNPAILYLLQSILDRRIEGEQAAQILSALPLHIRTPTQNILQLFFQVVKNEDAVARKSQVRTSAILAFSTLLNMACIKKRIAQNRYPVAQYGEFCSAQIANEKFIPYFQEKFDSEIQNFQNGANQNSNKNNSTHELLTLISAFGNIGNSHGLLKNIKKLFEIPAISSMIKIRALFSLQNIIRQNQDQHQDESIKEEILPFLNFVAFDQAADSKVRNAALTLIFEAPSSDISWWQKAAMSTWSESESESKSESDVHSFIFSTISNLARLNGLKNPPVTTVQKERQKKAQSVLKLMKPNPTVTDGFFDTSQNFYRNGDDESIKSGFSQNLFYFQNGDSPSILPDEVQYSNLMELGNGAAILRPLKWALSGNILSTWTNLVKLYNGFDLPSRKSRDFINEIFKDFNIHESRSGEKNGKNGDKLDGSIHFKLADQVERLWTLNDETLDYFKKFVTAEGGSTLRLNYQKAVRLVDHFISVPTIFGLPVVHRFEVPAFFSLRGQGKVKGDQKPYLMQADVAPLLTWKIQRSMSINSPLTSKVYRAGFERETVFDIPFTGRIRDIPHTCIEMAATPRHLGDSKPKGAIDLISISQIPYTAVISDDLEKMVIDDGNGNGGNMLRSIFDTERPTDFQEQSFGGNSLGLDFNIRVKGPRKPRFLEDPDYEPGSKSAIHLFLRQIFLLTDTSYRHSRFGDLLQPKDMRISERKLTLNLDTSQTKTPYFMMAGGPTVEKVVQKTSVDSNETTKNSPDFTNFNASSAARQIFDFETRQIHTEQAVVALLGKTDSLKLISEGNSTSPWNLIPTPSQNTFRLLASLQYNSQGDDLLGQLALGQTAQDAAYYLPLKSSKAFHWIKAALSSPVPLDGRWNRDKGVIQGQLNLKYPDFVRTDGSALFLLREHLLANPLTLDIWAGVKAGLSLHLLLPVMTIQGLLRRSDDMTKWATDLSPEARRCKKDIESKSFTSSPACIKVTKEQAGALNELELNLQQTVSTSTSDDLIIQIEDLLKAVFYTKMSQAPSTGAAGIRPSLQISGRHVPDVSHISFQLQRSAYTLRFDNVETHPLLLRLLPLRVDQNPVQVVHDLFFFLPQSNSGQRLCTVEAYNVQTFDKFSYVFDQQWISNRSHSNSNLNAHLLTMDCSRQYADAVLIHNLETRSKRHIAIFLEGQTTIQIQFGSSSGSRSRSAVWVNGKQVQLPFVIKSSSQSPSFGVSAKEIAEIVSTANGSVRVKGQRLQVIADGQRVIIIKSQALSGRTCGICDASNSQGLARPFQNFRFSLASPFLTNSDLNSSS